MWKAKPQLPFGIGAHYETARVFGALIELVTAQWITVDFEIFNHQIEEDSDRKDHEEPLFVDDYHDPAEKEDDNLFGSPDSSYSDPFYPDANREEQEESLFARAPLVAANEDNGSPTSTESGEVSSDRSDDGIDIDYDGGAHLIAGDDEDDAD
ncbi:hypothetical protein M426DRAFT_11004 [Hypoxylon sp. CI-4A]|nr:hypothetical protein M426DRAFT_11004 [Hypoxylon sp. CI-4A]